ncbi:MAG: hypothetical protein HQL27_01225 [Candidatus Omnitrophica bacterium]|nr:hypothetical protein [Candidatus Omnitrophota bacterium]
MKLEKISIAFFIITIILLVSLTAISMFFFQKEIERRKTVETMLSKSKANEDDLNRGLDGFKKKAYLLEEKNKELDDKINNLMGELDIEKGLREQAKLENIAAKEELDKIKKDKERLEADLNIITQQISDVKNLLKEKDGKVTELEKAISDKEKSLEALKKELDDLKNRVSSSGGNNSSEGIAPQGVLDQPKITVDVTDGRESVLKGSSGMGSSVEVQPIVVVPSKDEPQTTGKAIPTGRILSVDTDTEFVIVNLGQKDGIKSGLVMAVYRGKEYLGDIKVTRVQNEMFAADVLPPLSAKVVRKNDQVSIKE